MLLIAAGEDPWFGVAIIAFFGLVIGILLLIGKYHPASNADVLDWKPTRSYEDEVRLELEDVDQMLEAQNERRRRSGRPERTEQDVQDQVAEDQRELKKRVAQYRGEDPSPEPSGGEPEHPRPAGD